VTYGESGPAGISSDQGCRSTRLIGSRGMTAGTMPSSSSKHHSPSAENQASFTSFVFAPKANCLDSWSSLARLICHSTDKRVVRFVYKVGKAGASEVSYSLRRLIRFVFPFLCLPRVALRFGFDASRGLSVPAKQARGVMGSRIGESRNRWPGRPHRRESPEFSLTFYPLSPAILSPPPSQHACDRQQRSFHRTRYA
jgi:hypothetical protein